MSATTIFISTPNTCSDYHLGRRNRRDHHRVLFPDHSLILNSKSSSLSPLVQIFVRYPYGRTQKRTSSISTPPFKPFVPVMEWQESTYVCLYLSFFLPFSPFFFSPSCFYILSCTIIFVFYCQFSILKLGVLSLWNF